MSATCHLVAVLRLPHWRLKVQSFQLHLTFCRSLNSCKPAWGNAPTWGVLSLTKAHTYWYKFVLPFALNIVKSVKSCVSNEWISTLKYFGGDSQIYDFVHYPPDFLSVSKDLADTNEMSRNKARNTAALILMITYTT